MSKSRFVVLACVLLLAVILAVPTTAAAAINPGIVWSVPVYQGPDNYYGGANVVAFTAGSTANVTVQVTNDQPVDVTIKEAKILVDWGLPEFQGTGPAVLRPGEVGSFTFAVAVPANASSAVLHSYQVKVGYQRQDAGYVWNYQANQTLGTGNGVNLQFQVPALHRPILASSLRVYLVTPTTITVADPSSYLLTPYTGLVTFSTAPALGTEVHADYQYFQVAGAGDGVKTVFITPNKPVVDGSLQVFVGNPTTGEFNPATGWTADYETGKITMPAAPTSFQVVYVTYQSWTRWPVVAANNLAVYGTDQAAAMTSFQEYTALNANAPAFWLPLSTAGATAKADAAVLAAQANARYAAGDFATAGDLYDQAVTRLKAAFQANASLSNTAESAVATLVQNAAPVVQAYGNKLNGEAEAARGQSSMYKNVGVFSILLGVATLFAGIGGILWAYSRLVEARRHDEVH